ncbi:hypothetical protein L2755_07745 [Shewanella abyssi]|uniref:hypothetical protein n=1 Tax=Shewanella abyssi TaxID=311789 RepID=UPI00200F1A97|nr:hypothetical protein [Shewanella abyssi]MCL1049511.1 hypothetical protein [Shewanella abyssi]
MSRVISVCDREADMLSYIQDKQKHNERFVVRTKHSRALIEAKSKPVNVVYAQEKASKNVTEPLRWVLLTTEPINTLTQALHIVNIYTARWRESIRSDQETGCGAYLSLTTYLA